MGIDHNEAKRRRTVDKPKLSTKHPIAAIEKRVIDSDAFCALSPSAVVVLLLLARNLEKNRNGHIFLAQDEAARRGVEKKTLYRSLKELAGHGFVYPTTRGGHGSCARYALTWLPLTRETKGLHLENFSPFAWRNWVPAVKKYRGGKMSTRLGQKSPQTIPLVDKFPPRVGDKFPPVECNTNTRLKREWIPGYLTRLKDSGLAGSQCFQTPRRGVLQ